jgi:hypothetical protein
VAARLFGTPPLPGNGLGFRRMLLPEVTEGVRISEEFAMNADGLRRIDVYPSQVGSPRGKIRLRVMAAESDGERDAHTADIPAGDFVGRQVYRFEFPPFLHSNNMRYVLEITSSLDDPAGGVAFWATKGRGSADDGLRFNGVDRFAELVYQTDAVFPPVVRPLRAGVWIGFFAIVLSWVVLTALLRVLAS